MTVPIVQTASNHITLLSSIGIVVVGFGLSIWKVGNGIKKDVDKKIEGLQSKEMCSVLNGHVKDTVDEIKSDVKKLLGRNNMK